MHTVRGGAMDAIEYLKDQHREIESLFDQIESALRTAPRRRLCRKLLDLIAIHSAIEEMIFYPAAANAGVEQLVPRAFEEHLAAERLITRTEPCGPRSDAAAKLAALREWKRQHARTEEEELFPTVKRLLDPDLLQVVGEQMASVADQLLGPGVGARQRLAARRAVA